MNMRTKLVIIAIISFLAIPCFSQQKMNWDKWTPFIGTWAGEGSGQPGQGGGTFCFAFDLDRNIIVRKSHSEYPATANKQKIVHDDLMIIYSGGSDNPAKAIYFDNEGHVINYSITYSEKSVILTSDKIANVPVFRLTYTLFDDNAVNTKFEMSKDGEKFMTYIEGKSTKKE